MSLLSKAEKLKPTATYFRKELALGAHSRSASVLNFVKSCYVAATRRILLLIVLNWLFFGGVLLGAFLTQVYPIASYVGSDGIGFPAVEGGVFAVLYIFLFNLVLSGFVLLTLSGALFFCLPVLFLFLRALLWGALVFSSPFELVVAVLPTLVLEGEAYVLASVAGVSIGLSWLKPRLMYRDEVLSRRKAFGRAWRECLRVYFWVAVLLFAASIVEVLTIYAVGTL